MVRVLDYTSSIISHYCTPTVLNFSKQRDNPYTSLLRSSLLSSILVVDYNDDHSKDDDQVGLARTLAVVVDDTDDDSFPIGSTCVILGGGTRGQNFPPLLFEMGGIR